MKRKTIKPIIISALMAVSFGATAVGTTFALFTDRADTKIEVTAGVVDIDGGVTSATFYSLDETTGKAVTVDGDAYVHASTDTEVTVEKNEVKLDRIVPGDRVVLGVKMSNSSNVNIKYRLRIQKSGTLAPSLKTTLSEGLATTWTEWKYGENRTDETGTITIEFPNIGTDITAREEGVNNAYQGKSALYKISFEAVQGNAAVVDDALLPIDDINASITPASYKEKEIAGETEKTFEYVSDDGKFVASGVVDNPELATKVTVTHKEAEAEYAPTFTVTNDENVEAYDVKVENYKGAVEVSIYVGEGLSSAVVYHNNEYLGGTYNSETGYVTFTTESFSPYHVVTSMAKNYIRTEEDLSAATQKGGNYILDADLTELPNYVINENVKVSLDLNGHKLSTAYQEGSTVRHEYLFNIEGALTMTDSSALKEGEVRARGIENDGGNLTINGGTYTNVDENGGAAIWNQNKYKQVGEYFVRKSDYEQYNNDEITNDINEMKIVVEDFDENYVYESANIGWNVGNNKFMLIYYKYSLEDTGVVTINNGTFKTEYVGEIKNGGPGAIISKKGTKLTINNANVNSVNLGCYAIIADGETYIKNANVYGAKGALAIDSGHAVIDGGTFKGKEFYGAWITNDGEDTTVLINGGEFEGKYGIYSSVDDGNQDESDVAITIKGGKFTGLNGAAIINDKHSTNEFALTIYGGLFNTDPSVYVAEGYVASLNDQQLYAVTKSNN
jgi:hypothetical protein